MRHLRSFLFGFAMLLTGGAMAMGVATFGGPGQPQDPGQLFNYLNQMVTQMNGIVCLYSCTNTGEAQFVSSQSWATNGVVATAMTSLGPVGSHTTVQQWLVVANPAGTVRFIPAF